MIAVEGAVQPDSETPFFLLGGSLHCRSFSLRKTTLGITGHWIIRLLIAAIQLVGELNEERKG